MDDTCNVTRPVDNTTPASPSKLLPLCIEAVRTCQSDANCNVLLHKFMFGPECRSVLYHQHEYPTCYPDCLIVHSRLTSDPYADNILDCDCEDFPLCSVRRSNFFKYCTVPGSDDYPTSGNFCERKLYVCLADEQCSQLYVGIFFDPGCIEIVRHVRTGGQGVMDCSSCMPALHKLRDHALGFDMFACPCATQPCYNAQRIFRNVCGIMEEPQALCSDARDHCNRDENCGNMQLTLLGECQNVIKNGSVCTEKCQNAYKTFRCHPRGKLVTSCHCGNDIKCSVAQYNFFKSCPASCHDLRGACRADKDCQMLLSDFSASCNEVLRFIKGETQSQPACYMPCVLAHHNLISHPLSKQLDKCDCGADPACTTLRSRFPELCPIPGNPQYPKGSNAGSTCEVIVQDCLQNSTCKDVLTAMVKDPSCNQIGSTSRTTPEDCQNCLKHLKVLASLGYNLVGCTCAMHSCKTRNNIIRSACPPS
jgi:hypothetical protein